MTEREPESPTRSGADGRWIGRRTVLGATLAGLAGVGAAGTATSRSGPAGDPANAAANGIQEFPNSVTIGARSDSIEYELSVDGRLEQDDGGGGDIQDGQRVTATLEGGGQNAYRFRGITAVLEVPRGVAEVTVDIEDDGSTGSDLLPHRMFLFGLGDPVEYRFTVGEALEYGPAAETEDTETPADRRVNERTVEGHVHAHDGEPLADDYRFAGTLTFSRLEGPVRVKLKPNHVPSEQTRGGGDGDDEGDAEDDE